MSEGLGYSTLLVSTAYDIQLALACPHKEKGIEVAVTCMCAFEKKKEHVIFLFFSVQH